MPNKYFTLIVIILGVILLGIFTAWLLVNRGYVKLPSITKPNQTNSAFPSATPSGSGANDTVSDGLNFTDKNQTASSSEIVLSGNNESGGSLAKLNTNPVGQLLAPRGSTSTVLFFERATGHLFQVLPSGPVFRLTNTTLPKVIRAWGGISGSSTNFLIQTNSGILETKQAWLENSSASSSASIFLGTEEEVGNNPKSLNIQDAPSSALAFAISPVGKNLVYARPSRDGVDLITADWKNVQTSKFLTLPLSQIELAWPTSTLIAIQTKPAYNAAGLLYFYNLQDRVLLRVLGGINGLSTRTSPSGRYVLYSSGGQALTTAIYDRERGVVTKTPFKTLAEKCAWNQESTKFYCAVPQDLPADNYPDAWYQGSIHLKDNFWELDLSNKKAQLLFESGLSGFGDQIDVTQPTLDENNRRLYFVNKNDFSLWALTLGIGF